MLEAPGLVAGLGYLAVMGEAGLANKRSVPHNHPNRTPAEGNILGEHARVIQRSDHLPPKTIYDWRHYLAVVKRKPRALRNGALLVELPHAFRQLQDDMLRKPGCDREMVDILALVLHHDEQAVLTAVELALVEGGADQNTYPEPVAPLT